MDAEEIKKLWRYPPAKSIEEVLAHMQQHLQPGARVSKLILTQWVNTLEKSVAALKTEEG